MQAREVERMPDTQGVATKRRRLRTELRRLREASGLNQAEVVRELDWSTSKLIRIENGSVGVSVTDVRALLGVYRAPDDAVDGLVQLARATKERQWWSAYRHILSPTYREFIGYEADASALLQFHPTIVPGLLQTEDYIRAILPAVALNPLSDELFEGLVEIRLRRQKEILHGGHPPDYTVIVDEAVLHRLVGGAKVMRAQLDHLTAMQGQQVSLGVLPFAAGGHPGMQGAFHVMEFTSAEDESVVFLETAVGNPVEREQDQVAQYREQFLGMLERSVRGNAAATLIRKIAKELS
jgi:transcriptional regulator with XRE-family HTH domain